MIKGESGWTLAPAYDLLNVTIVLPEDSEEMALTLEGKRSKFNRNHFTKFAIGMGLTDRQIQSAINRMLEKKPQAIEWIHKSFLSDQKKEDYLKLLDARYARLS